MTNARRTVVFCPRCGSTDAGASDDELTSPGYTRMRCGQCFYWAFCDEWELRFHWNSSLSLDPSAALPCFVLPRERLVHAVRWGAVASRAASVDADAFASERAVLAVCDAVDDAWSEPHRRYHSLQHLSECLRWLDDPALDGALARPLEVALALFFHDLVYDTARSDNEEASAERAVALLTAVEGSDAAAIERVRAMILATKSHTAATDDERVMLDVDLSILGADERRFAEYEQQIREEYHWVHGDAYRAGRRRVLEGFAQRARIFQSHTMFERLESRARANLARALAT